MTILVQHLTADVINKNDNNDKEPTESEHEEVEIRKNKPYINLRKDKAIKEMRKDLNFFKACHPVKPRQENDHTLHQYNCKTTDDLKPYSPSRTR